MRRHPNRLAPVEPQPQRRGAFTLVELMIVVVVIAILMALVLPAVMGSFRTARISAVTTEIRGLEAAIAQFKSVYGIEPPSRIRLFETQAGWQTPAMGTTPEPITGIALSNEAERTRSVAFMNQIWPSYDFSIPHDFNGDGMASGFVALSGPECLVFFLGGRPVGSATTAFALTGFSKNPADPFAVAAGTETREGPYFEFKPSQLKTSKNTAAGGALVYFDPLPGQTAPYVYASSYDGRGYQTPDVFANSADDLNNVYFSGTAGSTTPQKNKSCQIISPGYDGFYGAGGLFNANQTGTKGLTDRRDYDNITNFHGGQLNK